MHSTLPQRNCAGLATTRRLDHVVAFYSFSLLAEGSPPQPIGGYNVIVHLRHNRLQMSSLSSSDNYVILQVPPIYEDDSAAARCRRLSKMYITGTGVLSQSSPPSNISAVIVISLAQARIGSDCDLLLLISLC